MFEILSNKLEQVFKTLRGQGKLTEKNIQDTLRQIRLVLLEADVNFRVARDFINGVGEQAVGQEVIKSITPGQQMVKIIHDEMVKLLGESAVELKLAPNPPTIIMLVGLQGSGKTTVAGKLAHFFLDRGRKPLLVAADVYRPAAIDQLEVLGGSLNVSVHSEGLTRDPVTICQQAVERAHIGGHDVVLLDTAGRLHIDDDMMVELEKIQHRLKPHGTLLVVDAMTGQDAVNVALTFNQRLAVTGMVLTKLDGDARGGAALSIRAVTGKPIIFVGTGEKLDALEPFHPDRMVSRILGMGDVVSLVEKAQSVVDIEQARELEQKIRQRSLTLEDFVEQIKQIRKMGSIEQLLDMIPGFNKLSTKGIDMDGKVLDHMEAIIHSMTPAERRKPSIIDGSRRKRIARGSGTSIQEVNNLLKQFQMTQKMMKRMGKLEGRKSLRGLSGFPNLGI